MTDDTTSTKQRLTLTPLEERVVALCEPVIDQLGFECVHLEYVNEEGRRVLRFYIDRPDDSGVNVDDCATVSRQLNVLLDVDDIVPGSYDLQVSSPGLDRPLGRRRDFAAQLGETVRLESHAPVNGRRRWTGILQTLDGGDVIVEVDGQDHRVPFDKIKRAKLKYAFGVGGIEGKKRA